MASARVGIIHTGPDAFRFGYNHQLSWLVLGSHPCRSGPPRCLCGREALERSGRLPLEHPKRGRRIAPLTIAIIPGSIFMLSLALGSLMLLIRNSTADEAVRVATLVLALVMAAGVVLGVVLILSLVFFTRPLWIVPPHIRTMIENR